jgi:hypothetical protein
LANRPTDGTRVSGGGRKAVEKKADLIPQLEAEIATDIPGDPCGPTKWLRQSLRGLKSHTGWFGGLTLAYEYPKLFTQAGHPVISVDTKKKELIGNFKNAGQAWNQAAELVNDYDFPSDAKAKAVPYGIYDVIHNQGYVYVGTSSDTAAFAVDAIGRWFERKDRPKFADESKILILCDAGGSKGYRVRNWKRELQRHFADLYGVEVMICHYPSGASKWNPIEHRLFSFISLNWAGIPLRSLSRMTALIRGTTTQASR